MATAETKNLITVVKEWAGVTIAVMLLLGGFAGFVLSTAHAQTDAGITSLQSAQRSLESRFERHVLDSAQVERILAEDVHQLRQEQNRMRQEQSDDIRALYQAVRTGRAQPILEEVARPDAGTATP